MRHLISLVACLVAALSVCQSAYGHAPPEVLQVVSSKSDDLILATNRGLIFGNRETRQFSLLCLQGLPDLVASAPYRVAQMKSGRLLLSDSLGLRASDNRGCSFRSLASLADLSTPDMVQDPHDPKRVYVLTVGTPGQVGVRISDDEGETFRTLVTVADRDYLLTMLLAPTEPAHLYVSANVPPMTAGARSTYYLTRSVDGGQTWQRFDVPLADNERDLTLLAVNPANPDELLARATAVEPALGERLLWSRDGGKTFSSPITLRALRAAAFSADGHVAYAGGVDGLFQATTTERTFVQVADTARVSQLSFDGPDLLACGYYNGIDAMQDGVGTRSNPALEFASWLDFYEVQGPVSCPAPSEVDARCAMWWHDWLIDIPRPPSGDAGLADDAGTPPSDAGAAHAMDAGHGATRDAAGADASRTAPAKPSSDGCSAVPSGRTGLSTLLLGMLGASFALRRRSRRLPCAPRYD